VVEMKNKYYYGEENVVDGYKEEKKRVS